MRAKAENNDFTGFTFNGIHSSQLGIIRTSDGSRFNEDLLPTIQDKTVQIPGGDGAYYFGSYYAQKNFSIPFAFDNLTEQEVSELKNWLGDKKIHELIFDELPYKAYQAKVAGSATIKHIPFGVTGERIYKGEGTIQFIAYQPFALSVFEFVEEENEEGKDYINREEWIGSSKLKSKYIKNEQGDTIGEYNVKNNLTIPLYNAGDKEADFNLKLNFFVLEENEEESTVVIEKDIIPEFQLTLKDEFGASAGILKFDKITRQGQDSYIKINTKLNILEGYDANNKKSGNIYNSSLISGSFFKIPTGEFTLEYSNLLEKYLDNEPIKYKYYYF